MVELRAGERGRIQALISGAQDAGALLPSVLLLVLLGVAPASRQASAAKPEPLSSARIETLSIPLSSGRTLQAQLRFPAGFRASRPLPAIVVLGGFQNAARVLDEVTELGLGRQAILASFDYPFSSPRRFRFPESLALYGEARRMLHDTREGIGVLARKLSQDPRVQPGVVALGASLGAPLVAMEAPQSSVIREVVLIHGFGKIQRTLESQLRRSAGPTVARAISFLAWRASGLPEPEQEVRRLRADQSVFWIEAERDSFIPREASDSLREAIRSSPARLEVLRTPGDHVQPGSVQLMREIGAAAWRWLGRVRPLRAGAQRAGNEKEDHSNSG
jgi:hypothetical protein